MFLILFFDIYLLFTPLAKTTVSNPDCLSIPSSISKNRIELKNGLTDGRARVVHSMSARQSARLLLTYLQTSPGSAPLSRRIVCFRRTMDDCPIALSSEGAGPKTRTRCLLGDRKERRDKPLEARSTSHLNCEGSRDVSSELVFLVRFMQVREIEREPRASVEAPRSQNGQGTHPPWAYVRKPTFALNATIMPNPRYIMTTGRTGFDRSGYEVQEPPSLQDSWVRPEAWWTMDIGCPHDARVGLDLFVRYTSAGCRTGQWSTRALFS